MGGRRQYLKWRFKIEAFEGNSNWHSMDGRLITPEGIEMGIVRVIRGLHNPLTIRNSNCTGDKRTS